MAAKKSPVSGPLNHFPASHSLRPAHGRLKRTPGSTEERMPPQASPHFDAPLAGYVEQPDSVLDPTQIKTVSVKEAAYRLRKSPDSIYAWLRRGRLRGWQPGGPGCQIQVIEASIDQALRNMLGPGAAVSKTA
jgi:excisionase family DNA binding protein